MSNDKVNATFHPDDQPEPPKRRPRAFRPDLRTEDQVRIAEARGKRQEPPNPMVHLDPEDPTAIPHAHMDEH